ncbi:LOW QUALITY PROTEIN: uncharacterized protein LOC112555845 [Pomacea canaliculata]|uniref:LOW QUALITY PROTEIN: uncharacterized protein LOC112555845 n=1 Tax=Pomacea canaliculata TaxID=400727 RepID=UPI000D72A4C6|nr:LOW QUALITY PROTEIN: uncharacterized protein LOC112555845 [Pomacea canaliculata]
MDDYSEERRSLLRSASSPSPTKSLADEIREAEAALVTVTYEHHTSQRSAVRIFVIAFICVITSVAMNVSLPVVAATMESVEGNVFTVLLYSALWFPLVFAVLALAAEGRTLKKVTVDKSLSLAPTSTWRVYCIMGLTMGLNGLIVVFASPPSRTAPYLQGLLSTSLIPFTVLSRFLLLRKGISLRRLGCTIAVLIGIFITVEPQIWSLPGSDDNSSSGESKVDRIVWPIIFAVGFLPAAVNVVICERELQKTQAQSLSFMTWCQVFQLFTLLPLFWMDFIPFFGTSNSFDDFRHHLRGFTCNFSSADDCRGLAAKNWLFILSYCLSNLFQFFLIQQTEGAVFTVVVQSLVTPMASLFWTFFKLDSSTLDLVWSPDFTETTVFTLGGLAIIVPAVILYNVFGRMDAKADDKTDIQMNKPEAVISTIHDDLQ